MAPNRSVMVFAATSLTDVLREIGKAYEAVHPAVKVYFNFAGSNYLGRQIENRIPADLYIPAGEAKMNKLQKKDLLLKDSRKDILSNSLVAIVPKSGGLDIPNLEALIGAQVQKLALADPEGVPAGTYARKYFENKGVWDKVKDRVVPAQNVRIALSAVECGDADAGVVFKTDAAISSKVRVAFEVPGENAPRIVYPAAVIKASKDTSAAKSFLGYLESKVGLAIFKKYGFLTLATR